MGGHGKEGHVTVPHDIPSGRLNTSNPHPEVSLYCILDDIH